MQAMSSSMFGTLGASTRDTHHPPLVDLPRYPFRQCPVWATAVDTRGKSNESLEPPLMFQVESWTIPSADSKVPYCPLRLCERCFFLQARPMQVGLTPLIHEEDAGGSRAAAGAPEPPSATEPHRTLLCDTEAFVKQRQGVLKNGLLLRLVPSAQEDRCTYPRVPKGPVTNNTTTQAMPVDGTFRLPNGASYVVLIESSEAGIEFEVQKVTLWGGHGGDQTIPVAFDERRVLQPRHRRLLVGSPMVDVAQDPVKTLSFLSVQRMLPEDHKGYTIDPLEMVSHISVVLRVLQPNPSSVLIEANGDHKYATAGADDRPVDARSSKRNRGGRLAPTTPTGFPNVDATTTTTSTRTTTSWGTDANVPAFVPSWGVNNGRAEDDVYAYPAHLKPTMSDSGGGMGGVGVGVDFADRDTALDFTGFSTGDDAWSLTPTFGGGGVRSHANNMLSTTVSFEIALEASDDVTSALAALRRRDQMRAADIAANLTQAESDIRAQKAALQSAIAKFKEVRTENPLDRLHPDVVKQAGLDALVQHADSSLGLMQVEEVRTDTSHRTVVGGLVPLGL